MSNTINNACYALDKHCECFSEIEDEVAFWESIIEYAECQLIGATDELAEQNLRAKQ